MYVHVSLVYLEPNSFHIHFHGIFCSKSKCVKLLQFLNVAMTADLGLCFHVCSCGKDLWREAWRLWQIIKMHQQSSLMQIPQDNSAVFRWNLPFITPIAIWNWLFDSGHLSHWPGKVECSCVKLPGCSCKVYLVNNNLIYVWLTKGRVTQHISSPGFYWFVYISEKQYFIWLLWCVVVHQVHFTKVIRVSYCWMTGSEFERNGGHLKTWVIFASFKLDPRRLGEVKYGNGSVSGSAVHLQLMFSPGHMAQKAAVHLLQFLLSLTTRLGSFNIF